MDVYKQFADEVFKAIDDLGDVLSRDEPPSPWRDLCEAIHHAYEDEDADSVRVAARKIIDRF